MRQIKWIVLHCTSSPQTQSLDTIKQWWKSLGWKKFGYHHLIAADGTNHYLTPIEQPSNGVAGYNANSIHISFIGGCDTKGQTLDNRTPQQKEVLKQLVIKYKTMFPEATILGHRDFSPDTNRNGKVGFFEWIKDCPAFDVKQWLKDEGIIKNPIMPTVKVATKNGGNVNLRKQPSTTGEILASIAAGTACIILGETNGWVEVSISDKIKGFIRKDYLQ